jgi:hypothetical protein
LQKTPSSELIQPGPIKHLSSNSEAVADGSLSGSSDALKGGSKRPPPRQLVICLALYDTGCLHQSLDVICSWIHTSMLMMVARYRDPETAAICSRARTLFRPEPEPLGRSYDWAAEPERDRIENFWPRSEADEKSGLQPGYFGKIECGIRKLGDLSLPMVLAALDADLYFAARSDIDPVAEQRPLGPRAAGGFERCALPPLDEGSSP